MQTRHFAAVLSLALVWAACDEASPVAPTGTTLTITANPSRIPATGTATISVAARRPNGTPVTPGTLIRFATDLGSIDESVPTDDQGVARASLSGDGRVGTATVSATAGVGEAVSIQVEIGSLAGSITLQASPSTIPSSGGTVQLLALVRDDEGQLVVNAGVNFTTEVGTLGSRGSVVFTNARGEARDTLTVSEGDLGAIQGAPSFTVRAQTAGTGGGLIERSFTIRIQSAAPIASFVPVDAGGFKVFFNNTTTGEEPLSFQWDFQNDGLVDSTERSPTFDYGNAGVFTVRLVATNAVGTDVEIQTISVPVP